MKDTLVKIFSVAKYNGLIKDEIFLITNEHPLYNTITSGHPDFISAVGIVNDKTAFIINTKHHIFSDEHMTYSTICHEIGHLYLNHHRFFTPENVRNSTIDELLNTEHEADKVGSNLFSLFFPIENYFYKSKDAERMEYTRKIYTSYKEEYA